MAKSSRDASDEIEDGREVRLEKKKPIDLDRAFEQRHKGKTTPESSATHAVPQEHELKGRKRVRESNEQHVERLKTELRRDPERLERQLQNRRKENQFKSESGHSLSPVGDRRKGINETADVRNLDKSASGDASNPIEHVWVDRGIVSTKISGIDRGEFANVWEQQRIHKHSKEDIDASLRGLQEAQTRLSAGATPEELRALASSSDPTLRQIGRSYKTYYDSDPIQVDFSGDGTSVVVKGRHRLARAEQLGIEDLPIRINDQRRNRSQEDR